MKKRITTKDTKDHERIRARCCSLRWIIHSATSRFGTQRSYDSEAVTESTVCRFPMSKLRIHPVHLPPGEFCHALFPSCPRLDAVLCRQFLAILARRQACARFQH